MIDSNSLKESDRAFYFNAGAHKLIADYLKSVIDTDCLILCIGTDRYIGDCLGPITGTLLEKRGFKHPLLGTLDSPVHAVNLKKQMDYIYDKYPNHKIIAVDACLGDQEYVGSIQARKGCIYPGKGVGKLLPPIGDISIIGVVDSATRDEFFNMHNIRLSMVVKMAELVSDALFSALEC